MPGGIAPLKVNKTPRTYLFGYVRGVCAVFCVGRGSFVGRGSEHPKKI